MAGNEKGKTEEHIQKIRAALMLVVEEYYSVRAAATKIGVRIKTLNDYYNAYRPANRDDILLVEPFKKGRPTYLKEEEEAVLKIVAQSFDQANLPITLKDLGATMYNLKRQREEGENIQNEEDSKRGKREKDEIKPPDLASVRRFAKRAGLKFRRTTQQEEN